MNRPIALLALLIAVIHARSAFGEDSSSTPKAKPIGEPQVFKNVDGRDLKLYVVKPPDWKASDKRPAVVFFHGGGWRSGKASQFNAESKYLASRGLVCFLAEYRLVPADDTPPVVCIEDARSAMRWVRSHASELGVNADRIAAAGGSAGGHLAAFVGLMDGMDAPQDDLAVSPKPQAMILYNPVFDNGPNGYGYRRVGERYKEFSPLHNVRPGAPPAIVILGTEDRLIPVATVEAFQEAMQAAGNRCEIRIYEGGKHGFFRSSVGDGSNFQKTLTEVDVFLNSLGWVEGEPSVPKPLPSEIKPPRVKKDSADEKYQTLEK